MSDAALPSTNPAGEHPTGVELPAPIGTLPGRRGSPDADVALPRFVQIEPVGRCNLHCRMCPVHLRDDVAGSRATMSLAVFERLLDGFAGATELHLQGLGEPMMNPAFFAMVRLAASRGMRVSTNTNLTLLTAARAELAADCGLAEISVSLDGATAATFESIRVGANFAKVLRNLRRLVDARASRGGTLPSVRIVMVLMRRNLDELAAMVRLAHDVGVDGVFVQRLSHDFGESTLPRQYRSMRAFIDGEALGADDAPRIERAYAEARGVAATLAVELRLPRILPRPAAPGVRRCDWPWRGAYVSWAGEAMPCCMVSTPDRARLGDMARDGVAEVWNGEGYARFRAALDSDRPPEICRSCSLYNGLF